MGPCNNCVSKSQTQTKQNNSDIFVRRVSRMQQCAKNEPKMINISNEEKAIASNQVKRFFTNKNVQLTGKGRNNLKSRTSLRRTDAQQSTYYQKEIQSNKTQSRKTADNSAPMLQSSMIFIDLESNEQKKNDSSSDKANSLPSQISMKARSHQNFPIPSSFGTKRKFNSDPTSKPRLNRIPEWTKSQPLKSSLPVNRAQPKNLSHFASNDLDLRQTFIPQKGSKQTQAGVPQKKYVAGLSVISESNIKSQINQNRNSSIISDGSVKMPKKEKFGPKMKASQSIQIKRVDSPILV